VDDRPGKGRKKERKEGEKDEMGKNFSKGTKKGRKSRNIIFYKTESMIKIC
jgi:hypothetical protein